MLSTPQIFHLPVSNGVALPGQQGGPGFHLAIRILHGGWRDKPRDWGFLLEL